MRLTATLISTGALICSAVLFYIRRHLNLLFSQGGVALSLLFLVGISFIGGGLKSYIDQRRAQGFGYRI